MEHIVRFEMTDEVIRQGIRRMAIEYLKFGAPAGLILWLLGAIGLRTIGASEGVIGAWIGMLIFVVGWSVFLHFHRIRRMISFHEKFSSREVVLVLLPEGIKVQHELGQQLLPWRVYNHLVRHRDMWFLHWSRYDFLMLPAAAFTPAAEQFMMEHILQAKGTVQ